MNLLDHFRRLFAYNEWANQEALNALQEQKADERSLALMAHVLSAERLWMERMKQQPQSLPVWPKGDIDHCRKQSSEVAQLWREYLGSMEREGPGKPISYENSKGENWTSSVGDILTHVILHSAYHRGQIASHMRETGQTPAYTDFIHGVRRGLVR